MIEAVFISDLHLHPEDKAIQARFDAFVRWARVSVKKIYILGDFFHAWAGDDALDAWSLSIAHQLNALTQTGISIFFMHGNRDFLLGKRFAELAGWTILPDPTVIYLGPVDSSSSVLAKPTFRGLSTESMAPEKKPQEVGGSINCKPNLDQTRILLSHGDRYCTRDKKHQYFRCLTRNKAFVSLFLKLPFTYRDALVNKVRKISQNQTMKTMEDMDVVEDAVISHMHKQNAEVLIHGHTHKPGQWTHQHNTKTLMRYVLSDWDDSPKILWYNNQVGFNFDQIGLLG